MADDLPFVSPTRLWEVDSSGEDANAQAQARLVSFAIQQYSNEGFPIANVLHDVKVQIECLAKDIREVTGHNADERILMQALLKLVIRKV